MSELSRLEDLRRLAPGRVGVQLERERAEPRANDELAKHLQRYVAVKEDLQRVGEATEALSRLCAELRASVPGTAEERADALVGRVRRLRLSVGKRLTSIKAENDELREAKKNRVTMQMRDNLFRMYAGQLQHAMDLFSEASAKFDAAKVDMMKHHMRVLTNGRVADDLLEEIVHGGNAKELLAHAVSADIDSVVFSIGARHKRIKRLEQNVREVQELFRDLAFLVDVQQESLDVIESRVANVNRVAALTVEQLEEAEHFQKKTFWAPWRRRRKRESSKSKPSRRRSNRP